MKKVFSMLMVVALVVVGTLGCAAAVYADDGIDGSASGAGAGRLTAEGDGIALLAGRGIVELSGNGILWIKDGSGDAEIRVTGSGHKTEFPDGWVQYAGFRGQAYVKGSRIGVIVAGTDIDLRAAGRGRVILWGHGSYQVNGTHGDWSTSGPGQKVKLASDTDTP